MASPGNQHCANCIGTLSFPIALSFLSVSGHLPPDICHPATCPFLRFLSVVYDRKHLSSPGYS